MIVPVAGKNHERKRQDQNFKANREYRSLPETAESYIENFMVALVVILPEDGCHWRVGFIKT